jgi:hypothetical protein
MLTAPHLPLAAAAGFPWMNLVWVLVGIAAFLVAVAAVGRYLAATHPDAPPKPRAAVPPAPAPVPAATPGVPAEIAAVIAAAVYATMGASARVTSVVLDESKPASVENLMHTWSLEGRREIYSSHRVR